MRYVAAALALTLAGCGGGDSKPGASSAPPATATATPTSALSPEARELRDAVAKSLAKCPCEVSVTVASSAGGAVKDVELKGYYDPAAGAASLRDASVPGVQVVYVRGSGYFTTDGLKKKQGYGLLDFGKVPEHPKPTAFGMLAGSDPGMSQALAQSVAEVTEKHEAGPRVTYDVTYDLATAARHTGRATDLFGRLLDDSNDFGQVVLVKGLLSEVSWNPYGPGRVRDDVRVRLVVRRFGVPNRTVAEPRSTGRIDVTEL